MMRTRTVAIVLAVVMLLCVAGAPAQAKSKLTPHPPMADPGGKTHASSPGSIPRTGADLPLEALLGALLVLGGCVVLRAQALDARR